MFCPKLKVKNVILSLCHTIHLHVLNNTVVSFLASDLFVVTNQSELEDYGWSILAVFSSTFLTHEVTRLYSEYIKLLLDRHCNAFRYISPPWYVI